MRAFLEQLQHGSEARREQIQRRHDSTIWTKIVSENVGL